MTLRTTVCLALVLQPILAGCVETKSTGSGSAGKGSAAAATASTVAVPAEVTLRALKLAEVDQLIASKKGKIVVVDAWSTYCEPCMQEFPGLVALHKKYGPGKVACISLCANFQGIGKPTDPDVIDEPLSFLKSQNATFDNVLCADSDSDLYAKWKFNSVPAIFVYDRDGKLLKKFENEVKYSEVEALVGPLLK